MLKDRSKEQDKPGTTVKFYGKKTYSLSPLIARKTIKEHIPNYGDEEQEPKSRE